MNFSGQLASGRMTWAAGIFNDWLQTGADYKKNARDVVGRVTALPWESPEKTEYVHVGVGLKRRGADGGMMRFSGRPESNVTVKYVDTKDFPARGANEVSFEALLAHGPFSVLAEHIGAWVDSPERGNPHFSGYYVAGSWMLTGEGRPYVRSGGYAAGVRPARRLGAVELVAKYSRVDLRDGGVAVVTGDHVADNGRQRRQMDELMKKAVLAVSVAGEAELIEWPRHRARGESHGQAENH